jgi:hypothetical protein
MNRTTLHHLRRALRPVCASAGLAAMRRTCGIAALAGLAATTAFAPNGAG